MILVTLKAYLLFLKSAIFELGHKTLVENNYLKKKDIKNVNQAFCFLYFFLLSFYL